MNDDIAIKVEHISKTFHEQAGARSLKEAFVNLGRKLTGKKENKFHKGDFTALKDINFEVKKGEFFGIVGRNGCGKSTLLKIIAGVYTPSEGAVSANGKLTPFIELGVGFNPELSGRDNVFLNGALLGFSRKQMEEMYDDIVDFAELHDFMETKLKNYSSGMQVRLAFSVAIRAESDILLVDEVLAVGDAAFQQKCFTYFEELKSKNKTVVFVTHDMASVKRFCTKAIYLKNSKLIKNGNPLDIADFYANENIEKKIVNKEENNESTIEILNIIEQNNKFKITIKYKTPVKDALFIGISIIKDGFSVAEVSTENKIHNLFNTGIVEYKLDANIFNGGMYSIAAGLFKKRNREVVALSDKNKSFIIKGYDIARGGSVKLQENWSIIK